MKIILSITFLIYIGLISAQTFTYPIVKKESKDVSEFVPKGWQLLAKANGDLNKDLSNDCALVIQYRDSIKVVKSENGIKENIITQPRMLLVLFHDNTTNTFRLVEMSKTFILCHDNPEMDDPFDSIYIDKGILNISFRLFYWTGSWDVNMTSYKFKYQNNEFTLIGAENNILNRSSLNFENYSYNFLSGKWTLTKGNDQSKQKPNPEWHRLNLKKLQTLKSLKQPFHWEVTKYIFL